MPTPGNTRQHPTEEEIDETLEESFPASDPPSWTLGLEQSQPVSAEEEVTQETTPRSIHPSTRIGHVHLKVADLERSLAFYCDVLGFELTQRYGPEAAFVSAGGYHHHIGLNTWESRGGAPPRLSQVLRPMWW